MSLPGKEGEGCQGRRRGSRDSGPFFRTHPGADPGGGLSRPLCISLHQLRRGWGAFAGIGPRERTPARAEVKGGASGQLLPRVPGKGSERGLLEGDRMRQGKRESLSPPRCKVYTRSQWTIKSRLWSKACWQTSGAMILDLGLVQFGGCLLMYSRGPQVL